MCLFPKVIKNRKYVPNKKNKGTPPTPPDRRVIMVPVGCGKCLECMKQRKRNWQIRLLEEIRTDRKAEFVTLTFSNENLRKLGEEIKTEGYERDNDIATLAVRRFLERWRKKHGISVKHWLVTELGHNGTENVHLHGLIWSKNKEDIKNIWGYGYVFVGDFVNEKTVNYISKYINKIDLLHKEYKPKVLTSHGIGKGYTLRHDSQLNKFKIYGETNETYKTREGFKMSLPIYYRNKIYTEDEREKLWLQKLDKQIRYVLGTAIDISKGEAEYYKTLQWAQMKNARLGYGDNSKDWNRIKYENERRNLLYGKRTEIHTGRQAINSKNSGTTRIARLDRLGIFKTN